MENSSQNQPINLGNSIQRGYTSPSLVNSGMASEHQVRQYLAYWFQLGKGVVIHNGSDVLLPRPVISGDRYSQAFEECWQQLIAPDAGDCYLEGTSQTIAELLSPAWEINPCSRCSMPVPVRSVGVASLECPCIDIPDWPNTEVPTPRAPIDNQTLLLRIRDRLREANSLADREQG
ncbi:hypothetical protein [Pantanalinema sp. GBBB05]|uniref:hypothetical protein n=1 Tax=Pantanalinema sp. GBBB05 TaxID=2604139 RepID=UPI003D818564